MKFSRIAPIVLILTSVSILASSCASKQNTTTASETQIVTVQRGDLSLDITAVGNLALSLKEDLAFEIPGTVEEVLVKEGDSVKEGQVLARLDTSEWDKQLTTLERAVTAAERKVTTAQNGLRDDQIAAITAQNTVTSNEFALRQAQLDLQTAQDALEQIADVKVVQDKIDNAEQTLNIAKGVLSGNYSIGMPASLDSYWANLMQLAQTELTQLNKEKQDLLAGTSLTASDSEAVALDIAKKQLAIEQKQLGITQAKLNLQKTNNALADARNKIAPDQEDIQSVQEDLKTAQNNLDDAEKNSPEVKAPFAGFITNVNVEGGDEVTKGKVAVTIADPNKFEATLLVSETNIPKIKLGGTASVELQAVSGVSLSANITYIAPTATVQSGVVNYRVKVELQSLQAGTQVQQRVSTRVTSGNASSGIPFATGGQASGSANLTQTPGGGFGRGGTGFRSANLTQEQINQAQQRLQALAGQAGAQTQTTATSTADIRLAEGMTATVTIPVESRTNVVLVRNRAISRSGGQTVVKVTKDGVIESRSITTGLSNGTNTEVVSGLSEGEQVVIPQTTTTTTTNTQQRQQPIMIPGLGGR